MRRVFVALVGAVLVVGGCSNRVAYEGRPIPSRPCPVHERADLAARHVVPRQRTGVIARPPDEEMKAILKAAIDNPTPFRYQVKVRLCVTSNGVVVSADVETASGLPGWDKRVVQSLRDARFCPFNPAGAELLCGTLTTVIRDPEAARSGTR